MASPVYNIWIRELNIQNVDGVPTPIGFKRTALVTDYVKLEFKKRYNNVGGWSLLMRNGSEGATLLRKAFIGSSSDRRGETSSSQGFGGITVVRNGTIVFSGPVRGFVATGDENDGPMIEFHGCDDTGYLADRVCMAPHFTAGVADPPPYTAPSNQGYGFYVYPDTTLPTIGYDASIVLANTVSLNIGPAAVYNTATFQTRQIPFLTIPPAPRNCPRFRVRARYQNLLEKCQEIAMYVQFNSTAEDYDPTYKGLQFSITQTDEDTLIFNYARPRNLTTSVVFFTGDPDLHIGGNIGSYRYSLDSPIVNYSIVAGQGETTARWFAHRGAGYDYSTVGNSVVIYGLREGFLDRRDIQYDNPILSPPNIDYTRMQGEFIRALDGQLREEGEITDLEVTAINNSPTEFFVDYNLGDFVQCRIEGQQIKGQVMDYVCTLTKDEGEVVQPTIGTQVIGSTTRLFNEIYKQQKDIGLLEKSQ